LTTTVLRRACTFGEHEPLALPMVPARGSLRRFGSDKEKRTLGPIT